MLASGSRLGEQGGADISDRDFQALFKLGLAALIDEEIDKCLGWARNRVITEYWHG